MVTGPRRIGKTYLLSEFAKKHFGTGVFHIELRQNPLALQILRRAKSPHELITELIKLLKFRFIPGKSVLIVEDLSEYPDCLKVLLALSLEFPDLPIIVSDAYLDLYLEKSGVKEDQYQKLTVAPLCFAEFLFAMGRPDTARIVSGMPMRVSVPIHEFLMQSLQTFLWIGGMPEVVKAYLSNHAFVDAFKAHNSIFSILLSDLGKITPELSGESMEAILRGVGKNLREEVDYPALGRDGSSRTNKRGYDILCQSGLVSRVPASSLNRAKVADDSSKSRFRSLIFDLGIAQHLQRLSVNFGVQTPDLFTFQGGTLLEQFVGLELKKSQSQGVFYWASRVKDSISRISFIAFSERETSPVVVSIGDSKKDFDSLEVCLSSNPSATGGILLNGDPYSGRTVNGVRYFPYYFAFNSSGGGIPEEMFATVE